MENKKKTFEFEKHARSPLFHCPFRIVNSLNDRLVKRERSPSSFPSRLVVLFSFLCANTKKKKEKEKQQQIVPRVKEGSLFFFIIILSVPGG